MAQHPPRKTATATLLGPASKRLHLNAFPRQRGSARADHVILKVSVAALHCASELIAVRAKVQLQVVPVDPGLFSALVKRKGDIARVVLVWPDELP
jgi:hypothetical protein